jgi:hypothetical protein
MEPGDYGVLHFALQFNDDIQLFGWIPAANYGVVERKPFGGSCPVNSILRHVVKETLDKTLLFKIMMLISITLWLTVLPTCATVFFDNDNWQSTKYGRRRNPVLPASVVVDGNNCYWCILFHLRQRVIIVTIRYVIRLLHILHAGLLLLLHCCCAYCCYCCLPTTTTTVIAVTATVLL